MTGDTQARYRATWNQMNREYLEACKQHRAGPPFFGVTDNGEGAVFRSIVETEAEMQARFKIYPLWDLERTMRKELKAKGFEMPPPLGTPEGWPTPQD